MYKSLFTGASVCLLTSVLSFGATIFDSGDVSLTANDPIQEGRLDRNVVPSDWSSQKPFPGVVDPNTSFHYVAFDIPASPFPFLQITSDDVSGSDHTFAAAYLNSYQPDSTAANRGLDTNYLGDVGQSGNRSGNPSVFQVVANSPLTNHLEVVVSDTTSTNSAIGQDFRIRVEGFTDTQFDDRNPAAAPEPANVALTGLGFAVASFALKRRRAKA